MLSLPLIPPRPDASLWPAHRVSNTYLHGSDGDSNNPTSNNDHRRPSSHHGSRNNSSRSMLAALTADENAIYQRKQNVRRFGAGWIRPPGVAKTYQAMIDEALEREEQEALARREQVLLDLAAAQTEAANQEAAADGEDQEMAEGERDLDDDVPEAEADHSDISTSDAGSEAEGDTSALGGQADMTFNEDSFIEGSMVAAEVEHMLEMEEAEMAGVLQDERDLDEDIPEAGSYEHTDTDLDSSSDERELSRLSAPGTGRRRSRRSSGARHGHVRRSIQRTSINFESRRGSIALGTDDRLGIDDSSSILEGSSFLRSSPAAARGSLRSRFMGARTPRGG